MGEEANRCGPGLEDWDAGDSQEWDPGVSSAGEVREEKLPSGLR